MKTFDDPRNNGTPQPNIPDNSIEDLTPMEEAEMYDNGPEAREERLSNNAVKGAAWLLGIVAVFAVAILFAWIVGKHDSPLSTRSDARQEYALSSAQQPLNPTLASAKGQLTPYQFVAILVPGNGTSSQSVKATGKVTAPATSAPQAAMTSSDADRIEREAREVIHGDFGDNPGRKAKLGADYAAVQARVNQILN